jgi:NAD(P)-dependent dehydrogenase (short-subunit alcohol dehydrogenase family)
MVDKTVARFGRLDVAVNNAATEGQVGPITDQTAESFAATFETNVLGVVLSMKHEVRAMQAQKSGSIINISSTYGVVSPDQSMYEGQRRGGREWYKPVGYSVAKAGMLNFTRWLAEYCAHERLGVRVNSLVPGGVKEDGHTPEFVAEYEKRTPLGRMAREDDYNGALVFLASRASAYMTGATLVVDGGWTAR